MNKYRTVLQILTIFIILFFLYLGYRFIASLNKKKRINSFSINIKTDNLSKNFLLRFINQFSQFLSSLVIFNSLSHTYDKYHTKYLTSGMDYISIKILLAFLLDILYMLITFLYQDSLSVLIILVMFIIGFILPDFYCLYLDKENKHLTDKDFLNALYLLKSNAHHKSIIIVLEKTILSLDNPLKKEFNKVLNDIKLGLSLHEAIYRMYQRTNYQVFKQFSYLLKVSHNDLLTSLNILEKELKGNEQLNNELKGIKSINTMSLVIFSLLPLIFISTFILFNEIYLNMILNEWGILIVLSLIISYILYVFILFRIGVADEKEN